MLKGVHRTIFARVAEAGEIDGPIVVWGIEDDDCIAAAHDLVRAGLIGGAFPPNANRKHGIEWGYLYSFRSKTRA